MGLLPIDLIPLGVSTNFVVQYHFKLESRVYQTSFTIWETDKVRPGQIIADKESWSFLQLWVYLVFAKTRPLCYVQMDFLPSVCASLTCDPLSLSSFQSSPCLPSVSLLFTAVHQAFPRCHSASVTSLYFYRLLHKSLWIHSLHNYHSLLLSLTPVFAVSLRLFLLQLYVFHSFLLYQSFFFLSLLAAFSLSGSISSIPHILSLPLCHFILIICLLLRPGQPGCVWAWVCDWLWG